MLYEMFLNLKTISVPLDITSLLTTLDEFETFVNFFLNNKVLSLHFTIVLNRNAVTSVRSDRLMLLTT